MCSQKFDLQVRFITPLHAFARVDACTCDSTHLLKESADTCARAHAHAHTHTHTHTQTHTHTHTHTHTLTWGKK